MRMQRFTISRPATPLDGEEKIAIGIGLASLILSSTKSIGGAYKMKIQIANKWNCLSVLALIAACVSFAEQGYAQGPAIAQPIANWSYTGHSSTLVEGSLRGQAAVISSVGQTVYLDSLAAVNYVEAYKRAIENSVAVTKAYYERREIREDFMQKYGPKPFIGEARKKFIEYYQPKRLSAQEFDQEHRKLTWPHILRQQQFAPVKEQVDQVFSARGPTNSGDGSTTHREVLQLCNALQGLLRENIGNMTADQYISGLEYVRSVELEARTTVTDIKASPPVLGEDKSNEAAAPALKKDPDTLSVKKKSDRLKI